MTAKILVVDDDPSALFLVSHCLREADWQVDTFTDIKAVFAALSAKHYDLVITDKNMPGIDSRNLGGMELLRHVKKEFPGTEALMMTAYATVDSALEAIRIGAFDYLRKPVKEKQLREKVERILSYQSFLTTESLVKSYKSLQEEVMLLLEQSSLAEEERRRLYLSVTQKIDHFAWAQKDRERVIIRQREALGNIAAQAGYLLDTMEPEDPGLEAVGKIMAETENTI